MLQQTLKSKTNRKQTGPEDQTDSDTLNVMHRPYLEGNVMIIMA